MSIIQASHGLRQIWTVGSSSETASAEPAQPRIQQDTLNRQAGRARAMRRP
ncbi:hypothetical protein SynBIOSE41_01699 [Synechococcus sp. BIOS-E4-1]|nr:hypothetical protein SynBIOSE41_01699 [Synechococcus sp. BIOS-E4-1]